VTVRLRFFASIREKLKRSEATCSLRDGATVRDLLDQLCKDYPAIQPMRASVSVAVNQEYVESDWRLGDNDEVALIPPVSGGRHV
jgi:molybdopterin converting factor subunit 1